MFDLKQNDKVPAELHGAVVAIGNFDGLHRGHQKILADAKALAEASGVAWGIVSFEPHPRTYFKPQEPVFRLTPHDLKARLLKTFGAKFLLSLDFNQELAQLSPEDFVMNYLVRNLKVSHVIAGYDFHFGRGRKGNVETLMAMGVVNGFRVTRMDQVSDEGDAQSPFSSSSIRSALRRGHVKNANHELGYTWTIMGEVVKGDQRGRTIGFPTANMIVEPGVEPARGIYAVTARDVSWSDDRPSWMGAAYFGDRPTFNTNRTFLETYLLDQDVDLYGKTLLISFVDMIRGDKTFSSVGELIDQMKLDCDRAREILSEI